MINDLTRSLSFCLKYSVKTFLFAYRHSVSSRALARIIREGTSAITSSRPKRLFGPIIKMVLLKRWNVRYTSHSFYATGMERVRSTSKNMSRATLPDLIMYRDSEALPRSYITKSINSFKNTLSLSEGALAQYSRESFDLHGVPAF